MTSSSASWAGRSPEGDAPLLHQEELMRHRERHVGVLLDQEDGGAIAIELADDGEDLGDDERREPERRLVHEQDARPRHQRARDRQHLLLAAESVPADCSRRSRRRGKRRIHALDIASTSPGSLALVGAGQQVLAHAHLREAPDGSPARARRPR
jgi:hypothetical protein